MPTRQRRANSSTSPAKRRTNFWTIFQKNFQFFKFSIILDICKFQEYFDNSRKFISRNKEFSFWHLQNIAKEKPYQSKTFDVVFNGAREIKRAIIRLL